MLITEVPIGSVVRTDRWRTTTYLKKVSETKGLLLQAFRAGDKFRIEISRINIDYYVNNATNFQIIPLAADPTININSMLMLYGLGD